MVATGYIMVAMYSSFSHIYQASVHLTMTPWTHTSLLVAYPWVELFLWALPVLIIDR